MDRPDCTGSQFQPLPPEPSAAPLRCPALMMRAWAHPAPVCSRLPVSPPYLPAHLPATRIPPSPSPPPLLSSSCPPTHTYTCAPPIHKCTTQALASRPNPPILSLAASPRLPSSSVPFNLSVSGLIINCCCWRGRQKQPQRPPMHAMPLPPRHLIADAAGWGQRHQGLPTNPKHPSMHALCCA